MNTIKELDAVAQPAICPNTGWSVAMWEPPCWCIARRGVCFAPRIDSIGDPTASIKVTVEIFADFPDGATDQVQVKPRSR